MRNEKTAILAGVFHENWRETRLLPDGSYDPRMKQTTDQEWASKHGVAEVDIANTVYDDLPSDWQAENKAAAEVIIDIVESYGSIDLSNPETYNQVGEEIHQAWLERNSWARGGELDVPFGELPENEQQKDISQMEIALTLFGKGVD